MDSRKEIVELLVGEAAGYGLPLDSRAVERVADVEAAGLIAAGLTVADVVDAVGYWCGGQFTRNRVVLARQMSEGERRSVWFVEDELSDIAAMVEDAVLEIVDGAGM